MFDSHATSDSGFNFRRALVTGGAGFIGSYVVRELLQRGIEVTVLDNLSTGRQANLPPEVRLVVADICDEDAARESTKDCDIVFHLAARVAVRSSFEFAFEDAQTNVAGTANVLRAAALSGSIKKFILASSMAVYADSHNRRLINENHPTRPASPYGVSKLAAENLTHLMCAEAGIKSTVLRLFNTYGIGQQFSPYVGVITIFINQLLANLAPTIYSDGTQTRDFVHVQDVAEGFMYAMQSDAKGRTYNIGSGSGLTVNQVFAYVRNALEANARARYVVAAPGELAFSVADIWRAKSELGYAPQRVLQTSLAEIIRAIQVSSDMQDKRLVQNKRDDDVPADKQQLSNKHQLADKHQSSVSAALPLAGFTSL